MSLAKLDIRRLFNIPFVYDLFQDFVGANALKERFIKKYIPSDKPVRLLEIGCGPGKNLDYMPPNVEYVGCDLSEEYIAHATKKYGNRAKFYCSSVADMGSLERDKFDIVMSTGVLHHLNDSLVHALCRECGLVLNEGGVFLAQEPCWTSTQSWVDRTVMSFDRGEDIRSIDGYANLLKESFENVEGHELATDVIIYPTSGCVIQASGYVT